MKIIITESQHNFLLEQFPEPGDKGFETKKPTKSQQKRSDDYAEEGGIKNEPTNVSIQGFYNPKDKHKYLTILQIGTAFIPYVGPFISAGIGLYDAKVYYDEGDKTSAGLTAAFSMLPFAGSIVMKIPGVKQLGVKGMSSLASKLASKSPLTKAELEVANSIVKLEPQIQKELMKITPKLTTVTKELKLHKANYIKRYGQESYEKLFRDYISGNSDKNYFIQTLKSSKKANPELANFATKFGIKLTQDELKIIKRISDGVIGNKPSQIMLVNTNKGLKKITVTVLDSKQISKFAPADTIGLASGDQIVLNKDLIKNYNSQRLQELIGHELAHIKDPALVSSKLKSTYNLDSLKNYNLHPLEVNAVKSASLQNLTTTTKDWMKYLPKDQLIGYLDDIIRYTKGQQIFDRNSLKMIGQDGLDQLVLYYKNDKKIYRSILTKLAQQAEYLKSQVNIAM
jgi:hypothetical protein